MMNELHSQGKTIEDIVGVLKRTPIHPHIVPAIEAAYSLGYLSVLITFDIFLPLSHLPNTPFCDQIIDEVRTCDVFRCDLKIVSDANMFFIETILKHHGVWNRFSEITANPSYVDEEGRLRIFPFHDYHKSSHGCKLCPPNMCKVILL